MSAKQPVNISVQSIEFIKDGIVSVGITFTPDTNISTYTRKCMKYGNTYFVIISGCRVSFDKHTNILGVTREYDTKGYKRQNTESITKRKPFDIDIEHLFGKDIDAVKSNSESETKVVKHKYKKNAKHEKYNIILKCIECNIPVYLCGPAGSGKNHTLEQIANELGYEFYFSNSVQQEYKLTGFIDAGGKYHETEFYKACTSEEECLFFLDEIDASTPEVLVLLNAAIANGYFEFPNGRVDFDNVHFVAAGNTTGSGADDLYTGRMVLDSATLDRFAIIDFNYDYDVELKLAKGNETLVTFIRALRKEIEVKRIRHTLSYRCISMTTKLERNGMDIVDIMRYVILKGVDKDTLNTLSVNTNCKYSDALNKLKLLK